MGWEAPSVPDLLASIDESRYGVAAPALRQTLALLGEGRGWFPPHDSAVVPSEARQWAADHLARLAGWTRDHVRLPAPDAVDWVLGGLGTYDGLASDRLDTEGWGDPWGPTEWGQLLVGLHVQRLQCIDADPALRRLIQPPLWPMPEQSKIIQPLLTQPGPPEPEYRAEPRWAMLCHVEYNLWRVLEWAVAEHGDLTTCPFEPLLKLHLSGWYPTGFVAGRLVVFGHAGTH